MKKGAIAFNSSLRTIIIVISLIVILLMIPFLSKSADKIKNLGCAASVQAKTLTSIEYNGLAFNNEMNVNCPTRIISFDQERVETIEKGKRVDKTKYSKHPEKELNNNLVNDILSKELSFCWEKFGAGTQDSFYVPKNFIKKWFTKDNYIGCRTCAKISFELEEEKEFSGLKQYLMDTRLNSYTKTELSPGTSYYDYIANKKRLFCHEDYLNAENCWEGFASEKKINTNMSLDSEEEYLIVFIREDMRKEKGTMNAYLMNRETESNICENPLPFRK